MNAESSNAPAPSRLARRRSIALNQGGTAFVQRRAQLVEAAAELFANDGVEATTLGDIARRADMKRAAAYYYFSSKEELLQEVVKEIITQNLARVRAIAEQDVPARQRLELALRDMMESYARNYPHQYIYVRADSQQLRDTSDPRTVEVMQLSADYLAVFTTIIREGIEHGEFRPVAPAEVIALAVTGMVNWTHRWFDPAGPQSGEELGRAFADLALGGLQRQEDDERDLA